MTDHERRKQGDILGRLKEATGPDRELDAAIVAELNDAIVKPYPPASDFGPHDRWQFWSRDGKHFLGSEHKFRVLQLTASVDAALALVEEKLPEANCYGVEVRPSTIDPFSIFDAYVSRNNVPSGHWLIEASGKTAPLAILTTMFTALSEGRADSASPPKTPEQG